jgi:hypothetical protein
MSVLFYTAFTYVAVFAMCCWQLIVNDFLLAVVFTREASIYGAVASLIFVAGAFVWSVVRAPGGGLDPRLVRGLRASGGGRFLGIGVAFGNLVAAINAS